MDKESTLSTKGRKPFENIVMQGHTVSSLQIKKCRSIYKTNLEHVKL